MGVISKTTFKRLLWAGLGLFFFAWAFALGVVVGQGYLDIGPEEMSSSLVDKLPPPPQPATPMPEVPEVEKPQLSFFERLDESQRPLPPKPRPKAAAQQPAAAPAAPDAPASSPPKADAAPAPAAGRYAVQVGSFREPSQADSLVSRLKEAGLEAYQIASQVEGVGLRYRVRVGPFATREAASEAAGRIRTQQKLAAYVTRAE